MQDGSEAKPPIIILVETMGSANVGSVARSARAFGLDRFRLVSAQCKVNQESKMWACYGSELLDRIEYYQTLEEALHDVDLAVALSRREGRYRHRHYKLASLKSQILPQVTEGVQVSYVFGNEESGLSRAHLSLCHYSAEIPTLVEEGSLNLAHAVSIVLYEILGRPHGGDQPIEPGSPHEEVAPLEKLQHLIRKGQATLDRVGYPVHHSTLDQEMVKLERLLHRVGLENWEVRLLLGMLKQVNTKLDESH